jgi:hypothetical protein
MTSHDEQAEVARYIATLTGQVLQRALVRSAVEASVAGGSTADLLRDELEQHLTDLRRRSEASGLSVADAVIEDTRARVVAELLHLGAL